MTMPAIETWLRQPAAHALGWALLQFVWQGAAVGALTGLALLALRRSAADVRYVVASIGLALMLTLPIVTGTQKFDALRQDASASGMEGTLSSPSAADGGSEVSVDPAPAALPRSDAGRLGSVRGLRAEPFIPLLMVVWLSGVTVLSLRLLSGWVWVQRLRTRGVRQAADVHRRMASRLSRRLHISRAVALLESTLVDVPTVVGFVKPVVLLPASALAGLTLQQLEAILAHELAHIRRHDYLVNLLQTLVETVLFYHPAVWWVSRRIRVERENCCDDLAVRLCGDPVAYASALADLEALRSGPVPDHHIAMAATGGSLLQRVRRLLGAPTSHTGRGPAWLAGSVAVLLVGGIALGADGLGRQSASPAATAAVVAPASAPAAPTVEAVVAAPALTGVPTADRRIAASVEASAAQASGAGSLDASARPALAPDVMPADAAVTASAMAAGSSQSVSISSHQNNSHGTWSWSSNGESLQVSFDGTFEFTDDDTDVSKVSPGGSLKISDGKWLGRHSIEIRERNGSLERRYYVNGAERPYEPEGRAWLRDNLPRFVRNTGIGAEARVARFLKSGGPSAVMGEIDRIDSAYVKGIYFKQLFAQAQLTPQEYRQAMAQAARGMKSSDYELAQLLIAVADRLPADEASRAAYFEAAGGIGSDYELRRVYSTMLKRGPVSPSILAGILEHSRSIDSDYELSQLLQQILSQQPLDDRNRAAFFAAAATIDSDYERGRVLTRAVGGDRPSDPALLEAALTQAGSMGSDYETSSFLLAALKQNGVEGPARAPFFKAVATLGSDYERGRVLKAVAGNANASRETLKEVLAAARAMSGYELSQLLQTVARTHAVTGDLRDAYLDAADRLSGYEQGQVMTALVRSERRK